MTSNSEQARARSTRVAQPALIAETPRWLVVYKPAGWLSIPGRSPGVPVLSEWVQALQAHAANAREASPSVWTVHRLDVETSGVILFARTEAAHREASGWFQNHQVKKAYDFLAAGKPQAPMMRVKAPVEGAPSTTQVEVREEFVAAGGTGAFLGRAVPLTGRRHQIRVHLAHVGNPLLGDPRYGGPLEVAGVAVSRVALHAARLELPSREVFEAPWPEDFAGWVRELRDSGKEKGAAPRGRPDSHE